MGEKTKIEWTDSTINFWMGCKKVSAGCKMCYWYRDADRYGLKAEIIRRTSARLWEQPYKWKKGHKIFTCSWSDFFIEEADQWREDAWNVIRNTPHHTWIILTKRPERIMDCLPQDWGKGWHNVWLGVSVENNLTVIRMQQLALIPAQTRFVSFEPLLEKINFSQAISLPLFRIDWIIIGGESGNSSFPARPCELSWIEHLIDIADRNNVPVFVKQLGTVLDKKHLIIPHTCQRYEWPCDSNEKE